LSAANGTGAADDTAVAVAGGRGAAWLVTGSGVMMLTAGVDAAVGNSALVGLPVGTAGGSAASGPGSGVGDAVAAGAFQDAA
jgi:hypothetical protein